MADGFDLHAAIAAELARRGAADGAAGGAAAPGPSPVAAAAPGPAPSAGGGFDLHSAIAAELTRRAVDPTATAPPTGAPVTMGGPVADPSAGVSPPQPTAAQFAQDDAAIAARKRGFAPPSANDLKPSGFQNAVNQGLTLGFGDEAGALGATAADYLRGRQAPEGFVPTFKRNLAGIQQEATDYSNEHPFLSLGGNLLGGFLSMRPGGVVNAASAAAQAPSRLTSIGTGAGLGAVSGFGGTNGDLADRAEGAAKGALMGGGIAAVAPTVVNALGTVGTKALQALGLRNPGTVATEKLMQAFERDGVAPEDALRQLQNWQLQGSKPEMLFDLGGENIKRLARSVAQTPGPGTEAAVNALGERQAGQAGRVSGDVAELLNPNADYHGTVDALQAARKGLAQPAYDKAFETNPWSPRLQEFLDDPVMRQGLNRGMKMLRLEAVAEGKPFDPHALGVDVDAEGNVVNVKVPNMRVLDAAKRGLDDILEQYRSPVTGKLQLTPEARALNGFQRAYIGELDSLNPDYAAARSIYAGPSKSLDALQRGRDFFKPDAEITTKVINDFSPGEREFFRTGVVRAIKDVLDKAPDGADVVKRLFGNTALKEKLEAAFDNPAQFNAFRARLDREAGLYKNAAFVSPRTGSQTSMRESDAADLGIDPRFGYLSGMAHDFASAPSLYQGVLRAGSRTLDAARAPSEAVSGELGRMMFNPDPAANAQVLQGLLNQRAAGQQSAEKMGLLRHALTSGAAAGLLSR